MLSICASWSCETFAPFVDWNGFRIEIVNAKIEKNFYLRKNSKKAFWWKLIIDPQLVNSHCDHTYQFHIDHRNDLGITELRNFNPSRFIKHTYFYSNVVISNHWQTHAQNRTDVLLSLSMENENWNGFNCTWNEEHLIFTKNNSAEKYAYM